MAPRPITVVPARLERAADGTPFSAQFADVYHSTDGGLAQARHVFLRGNELPERWRGRDSFTIVETGFGLGLNFLATWDAWRADSKRCARLHFVSVEKHPLLQRDLAAALAPFETLSALSHALVAGWPLPVAGFHRLSFEGGRVMLTLVFEDVLEALAQLQASADALFLDGFSPARNPGMWSPEVVRELARLARPGATLATWTVAGGVRTALADAGFDVGKRSGFGSKREMLVGARRGSAQDLRADRRAIVVGGGLAGTLAGERMASRGWDVALVDARARRSAPLAGLLRPIVNLRDALNAQLSRTAFSYALQYYRALQADGFHLEWNPCGVLQVAPSADEEARFSAIVESLGYPAGLLEYVDEARAAGIAGRKVARGGWWFAGGGVVSLESLAVAAQARAGALLTPVQGGRVDRVERNGSNWRALDGEGRVIAEAPVIIIANAADASRLLPDTGLPLSAVRGQVTYLPAHAARKLGIVVSGNGYVAPLGHGHVVGASYRHDDFDGEVREADHGENLARAESMLPGFVDGLEPAALSGWTGFRATVPDRLPIYGATLRPGLFTATGLGSRGLLWVPIGAELLACTLESEPLPLPLRFLSAVSPRRFR
jgi:tRNA 5-methylaminomethyl-2-thiouridine biosynthesis bifunctional protein